MNTQSQLPTTYKENLSEDQFMKVIKVESNDLREDDHKDVIYTKGILMVNPKHSDSKCKDKVDLLLFRIKSNISLEHIKENHIKYKKLQEAMQSIKQIDAKELLKIYSLLPLLLSIFQV